MAFGTFIDAGGAETEEYYIRNAIRWLQKENPSISVQVQNVCVVGNQLLPTSVAEQYAESPVKIRCLTHCDTLPQSALKQQLEFSQHQDPDAAIFGLDMSIVTHSNHLMELKLGLFGAVRTVDDIRRQVVFMGAPNQGKSSIILPLTKARTLQVKKKRHHHLPKVSSRAGQTMGVKSHILEATTKVASMQPIRLVDTPGLRMRLSLSSLAQKGLMLASNVVEPFSGYKTVVGDLVPKNLLRALNRVGDMSGEAPEYTDILGIDATNNVDEFLEAYRQHHGEPVDHAIVKHLHSGYLGGMVFSPDHRCTGSDIELIDNKKSGIVFMNDRAKELVKIAQEQASVKLISGRSRILSTTLDATNYPDNDGQRAKHTSAQPGLAFPRYRQSYNCMVCAGFIKRENIKVSKTKQCKTKEYGCRHTRVLAWQYNDILSYFSRMTEAFGNSKHVRYLMRDSLACTLMAKHKLLSRAQVYKRFNSLEEFPVPSSLRSHRFQSEKPIPFVPVCQRIGMNLSNCMEGLNPNDYPNNYISKEERRVLQGGAQNDIARAEHFADLKIKRIRNRKNRLI